MEISVLRVGKVRQCHQESPHTYPNVLLTSRPHEFKHCKLKMERHDLAYAKPLSDPSLLIKITGRGNVGRSFPGDEVCVQILATETEANGDTIVTGKVVESMRDDEEYGSFICKMSDSSGFVTPVKNNMTRIRILEPKPGKINVRRFNGRMWESDHFVDKADDQLLVVKVLKWDHNCTFPLGVVTKVFSYKDYLYEMFEIVSKEWERKCAPASSHPPRDGKEDDEIREDFRDDTTFTIDSDDAQDLDDAVSLTETEETYVIAIHVTDVACYIRKNSDEDVYARQLGRTFYPPNGEKAKTTFMVSRKLSSEHLSLVPGEDRKAISLLTVIDKATDAIESSRFTLSHVRSDRRLSYEEADRIIRERCLDESGPLDFTKVEDCLAKIYRFANLHRKQRLDGGWSSGEWTRQSRAHFMVEELMNLYNSAAAEELISNDRTIDLTPLRCHQKPDDEDLEQFRCNHSALLPLSVYLSHICEAKEIKSTEENSQEEDGPIFVITPVLQKMKALAECRDYYTLVQLIISDDIHPKLRPMAKEFKDLQKKAVVLRSCTSLPSKLGHFGLKLNAYTWASSPMRRYLDLILQRHLHSVLEGEDVGYTQAEIDELCNTSVVQQDFAEDFDMEALTVMTKTRFSSRAVAKLAVVEQLAPKEHEFRISLPFDKISEGFSIMYRNLKVDKQPEYSSDEKSVTLHWKRRVYSFSNDLKIQSQSKHRKNVTPISTKTWRQITSAVKAEDLETVVACLKDVGMETQTEETCSKDSQHFKEVEMELKVGEVLQVQLGLENINSTTTPTVKLLSVNSSFEVCLEHARNPTMCFSTGFCRPTMSRYRNCEEYQNIWSELCKMDTAYCAVEDNNSVILEDVRITWRDQTEGYFKMTQAQKKDWRLDLQDLNLANCFLCIRLRDLYPENGEQTEERQSSGFPVLQDALPLTWVAHGVVMNQEEENKESVIQVKFKINHQNTPEVPAKVFDKGTKFTVELIPMKIPCVLRELVVAKLKTANELVKSIATGDISNDHSTKCEVLYSVDPRLDLPRLNISQKQAVQEALHNQFTVIQGPPGTGKTVVGVHITYQFYMKNQEFLKDESAQKPPTTDQSTPPEEKVPKKCGILYCGPSNKSVDIVAEQLLKLRGVLKPLRVYCGQMEMREFPYPGSDLKLCRRFLREERPKEELRDITLMYLVRKPENPHAEEIQRLEGSSEDTFDIESYRNVLWKARKHELLKHDVILCTCSSALNSNIIHTMDFRQILIDECAMATEPEAFIPLVSYNPQQIVLLGDHKQLQPIVGCAVVKEQGMQRSLFERYMERAQLLDTQYRMHMSICQFPSNQFYGGKLKTGDVQRCCFLLNDKSEPTAVLFGHVEGDEDRLIVSTAAGNDKSVANKAQAKQAVRVAELLVYQSGVEPEKIAILTPYNAQVCSIKEILKKRKKKKPGMESINVCTIMKSQGSEWPYVIISTVRSCPLSEIKCKTHFSRRWMQNRLGFITDPNQVNVAITRAQNGLCILGNRHLLECSELWRKLLEHYQSQHSVVDFAQNIKVVVSCPSSPTSKDQNCSPSKKSKIRSL
ncbi:3'-5' exoribonuclease HELZ2-like [Hoplias malabaricus]|uniref:3'-5' exoribonuclease HELZ2-like n=1 Tax=Hoplias malabaricus TaxID=27720 RepID=UPI0034628303